MTMPGEGDRTVPAPPSGRARPTGEPTVPAGPPGGGPGGPPPPGGPGGPGPGDRGAILLLTGSTLAGLAVGAVLALAVGSGTGRPTATTASSSTSTSSSTTTSSPTTTSTTAPALPQILALQASPTSPTCLPNNAVLLTWSTQNAVSVTISADGLPIGGTFAPSGSHSAPFRCPPLAHRYVLVATSAAGRQTSRSLTVTAPPLPTTSTSTSTTTTT
jgi:hypothetical protein